MVGVIHTGNLYWLTLAALIVVYLLTLRMITSPTGHIWEGIRENERRVEMVGLRPYTYKLAVFVISSVIAAVAGALYLFLSSGATPASVRSDFTVALLLMVIIGGSGALWGPVAGAMLYHYLDVRLTTWAASSTVSALPGFLSRPLADPLFILGIIFVLLVLFFPRGIAGTFVTRRFRASERKESRL
jgi:branched-chain amino acid transport system permease protein